MVARRLLCCLAGRIAFGAVSPISSVAIAQTKLPEPGSRVRVTAPDHDLRQATGRVLRLTGDSITIDRDGARPDVTLAVNSMSRLEVSTGKRHGLGFVQGAGAGLVIGALLGIAWGSLQYLSCSVEGVRALVSGHHPGRRGRWPPHRKHCSGAARPPDRWEDVSLPRQSGQSSIGERPRATGIGLSISF